MKTAKNLKMAVKMCNFESLNYKNHNSVRRWFEPNTYGMRARHAAPTLPAHVF
jgi:hypothetical protein